ncbi:RDD family protein [Bacillus sp. 31A1R]|uniref:RDD family protein n=1 Tax=Robertmurraya mangrovi TaxID=3098077 RepID=A0ABU5ITW6_9BACI|nr:RDD family protein [Bacillus sp. 31A1R]MDZ5470583.1 RDD family protein [Bacillus sp. 31A1R]
MENQFESEKGLFEEPKEYASFWQRFVAYLIDGVVLGIPLAILTIIIITIFFGSTGATDILMSSAYGGELTDEEALTFLGTYLSAVFVSILINFVIAVAYYAGLHASKWQGTVGKKLLGIKVTDLHGNRISFWRGLGRYAAMGFLSGIFMIGFIMAAFTEKKQALHDMIAGTLVVKK